MLSVLQICSGLKNPGNALILQKEHVNVKCTRNHGINRGKSKLVNERMRSTKFRKKKYLGAENIVRAVMMGTANTKKSYYFSCEYCKESYLGNNFVQHLVAKHKFTTRKGKMLQNKLRVLYLWSLKNKKGVQRPLPYESCGIRHLRLDNHLKLKHN